MCKNCGCCSGIKRQTPLSLANRPGLDALRYRVGTHASFLASMKASLAGHFLLPAGEDQAEAQETRQAKDRPLRGLTTRSPGDPAIAFLDAWAVVGDVLTFYQERIVNEGYLRTATERRSLFELARLVGYRPRPGVSASAFLAYTLDASAVGELVIKAGAQVKSIPGEGETSQTFETAEKLSARLAWNNLAPRLTRPQRITLANALLIDRIYFAGVSTRLKPNDPLLLVFGDEPGHQVLRRVRSITPQAEASRSLVLLQAVHPLWAAVASLLRIGVEGLERWLSQQVNPGPNAVLAEWAQALSQLLLGILENVQLGHVPPLQPDRQQFTPAFRDSDATLIRSRVPVDSYIPLDRLVRFNRTDGEEARQQVFADPDLLDLAARLSSEATGWLSDPQVSSGLVCLLADWVNRLHPIDHDEWQVLHRRLNNLEQEETTLKLLQVLFASPLAFVRKLPLEPPVPDRLHAPLAGFVEAALGLASVEPLRSALQRLLKAVDQAIAAFPVFEAAGLEKTARASHEAQGWLKRQPAPGQPAGYCTPQTGLRADLPGLAAALRRLPARPPAGPAQLRRSLASAYRPASDVLPRLLVSLQPGMQNLYAAWAKAAVSPADPELKAAYALRLNVAPFGYNAPLIMGLKPNPDTSTSSEIKFVSTPAGDHSLTDPGDEQPQQIFLDNGYAEILPDSWLVLHRPAFGHLAARVRAAEVRPRTAYTLSAKATRLQLSRSWLVFNLLDGLGLLRKTAVLANSELLPLVDEPVEADVFGDRIELDALVEGLQPGRWLIVTGERTDIAGTSGVQAGELAMLQAVEQGFDSTLPGDPTRTTLVLSTPLAFRYKRDTVTVFGNVVKATHGATQVEVLGSGDGGRAWQVFPLRTPPLTFLPAPTPSGAGTTLEVRVDGVLWREAASFDRMGPTDRNYVIQTNDKGETSVLCGDGHTGSRLPTGVENVRAVYRSGLGKAGNLRAEQLKLLVDRPLGVRQVTNPLPAGAGADPESRDQVRRNAPLAVQALDRLVSVRDYEDFARTFAGIAKASAARLTDGRREVVYLTIAGQEDMAIDPNSDLYLNLLAALRRFGDPYQPCRVVNRTLFSLIVSAHVGVLPDYLWENISAAIRQSLYDVFGFDRRQLGQDVFAGEVVAAIQSVRGVAFVDLDVLDVVSEEDVLAFLSLPEDQRQSLNFLEFLGQRRQSLGGAAAGGALRPRIPVRLAEVQGRDVFPAELAVLRPDVPDTLFLQEVRL